MSRRQFLALITPLILLLLGFVAMIVVERTGAVGPPWDEDFARYVRTTLAYEFVGGVDDDRHAWEAYFAGLNAYLRHLDTYAEVIPPWHVARSREESEGQYVGIGVRTDPSEEGGGIEVTGVKPDGPADKAGISVGDVILGVDGETIAEISPSGDFEAVAARIKGKQGSTVRLTVRDPANRVREVSVKRASVDSGSVFGTRWVDDEARIAYIRLAAFKKNTAHTFKQKLKAMIDDGAKGLVLDLRANSGGILQQAAAVADALLDSGSIVSVRGRGAEFDETLRATEEGTVSATLPVAVLVDRSSASASEILAGALQDHRRAILIGVRTWGKFLVQTVQSVAMDHGTVLFKRTSAIYETPLGHNYQRRAHAGSHDPLAGLSPDIFIAIHDVDEHDRAVRLQGAAWRSHRRECQQEKLYAIFNNEVFADWNPNRPPVHPEFVDRALRAAVAVLRGEPVYPRVPG